MTETKRLTDEQLAEIRERAEKAMEGPWRIGKQSPNGAQNVGTMGGLLTAQTTDLDNATFIAHAREDIPKLVAEIERLRKQLTLIHSDTFYEDDEFISIKHVIRKRTEIALGGERK
ncbi:hypothetical protein SAMN05216389_11154 [Oceanobacillus limi]|uniref:Ead/Ea22-like family protein n=1 Tax=Oceanobacillus limi TaxID=930131 RepID=A0A1I0EDU9_9BACI|nr:hypothetical protein [Oceanobacillus limi]SET43222.1 hypothetical protein SAMN05216389_11154 [Oceanobacillus limi]